MAVDIVHALRERGYENHEQIMQIGIGLGGQQQRVELSRREGVLPARQRIQLLACRRMNGQA